MIVVPGKIGVVIYFSPSLIDVSHSLPKRLVADYFNGLAAADRNRAYLVGGFTSGKTIVEFLSQNPRFSTDLDGNTDSKGFRLVKRLVKHEAPECEPHSSLSLAAFLGLIIS